jgi:hypothetical protein
MDAPRSLGPRRLAASLREFLPAIAHKTKGEQVLCVTGTL